MRRKRRNSGFTMMELLIVVAIIGILAGVGFIAVQNHQRSMVQLEEDAVAKEIFVAAQNHLMMARNENYLGVGKSNWGTQLAEEEEKGIYYIICNNGSSSNTPDDTMLDDVMLPFGSIDEIVRNGNFIIRYQPQYGLVLDVWYAKRDTRYGIEFTSGDYSDLLSSDNYGADKKSNRMKYNDGIVGWYGGQEAADVINALKEEKELKKPVLKIKNGDKLTVTVTDTNPGLELGEAGDYILKLIIKGEDSNQQEDIVLRSKAKDSGAGDDYTYDLDDITVNEKHFAQQFTSFYPGENITIQAVAYKTEVLSNIGYSDVERTNSLFEKLDTDTGTVSINSIRHLENLDKTISTTDGNETKFVSFSNVVQTTDLSWEGFKNSEDVTKNNEGKVQIYGKSGPATDPDCFKPVNPDYLIHYDGQKHNIFKLNVNYAGNAGLFGELKVAGTSIENLALVDSTIKSTTGNAGALAGTVTEAAIDNVVAYNIESNRTAVNITADAGHAGGLVGSMTGTTTSTTEGSTTTTTTAGSISKSAAALIVSSTGGNAGGLIGTANGCTLNACYSGGHTENGAYYRMKTTTDPNDGSTKTEKEFIYNVTATGTGMVAGGLIGVATNMPGTTNCYTTCSVTGDVAGGFAGTYGAAAGSNLSNCYATGLVKAASSESVGTVTLPKDGAFAYELTGNPTVTNCKYYEIINERVQRDDTTTSTVYVQSPDADTSKNTYVYLTALGKNGTNTSITALDADAGTYDSFIPTPTEWKEAMVYDAKLGEYYNASGVTKYNLKTVEQLIKEVTPSPEPINGFVSRHYGDWPAPEIFVFNEATTSGSNP